MVSIEMNGKVTKNGKPIIFKEMENDLTTYWKEYTKWLITRLPNYGKKFNQGATAAEIKTLVDHFDFPLSLEILELYQLNNGEQVPFPPQLGTFLGLTFLPISKVLEEWMEWEEIRQEMDWGDDYFGSSFPEKAIKIQYTNPKWIPLFYDFSGNFIGIDHDPDIFGKIGQVINFGSGEDDKFVIANSLEEFLRFIVSEVENGNCEQSIYQAEDGSYSYGLSPQNHLIDDLRRIKGC